MHFFGCSYIIKIRRKPKNGAYARKEKDMKYICDVCGYEYDEEAEGVKWEDLPDDYVCPLCGVGKDQFSPAE